MKPSHRQSSLILLGIMILATALRLHGLGRQSVWFDEALSASIAATDLRQVSSEVQYREQIPPLHHFILHFWMQRWGDSEYAIRFPSAVFGILSVYVIFRFGQYLYSWREGLIAALLMALSSFQIYYSQEARPYTLLVLTSLLSCYAFMKVLREGGRWAQCAYVLATAALFYTHLYGIFIVAAQHLAYLAGRYRGRPLAVTRDRWLNLNAAVLVLYLPWVPVVFRLWQRATQSFWIPPFGVGILPHTYTYMLGSGAAVILLLALAVWGIRKTDDLVGAVLIGGIALMPVLMPVLISWMTRPLFAPRYGIAAGAGIALLCARGLMMLPPRHGTVVAALLAGLIGWEHATFDARLGVKEDWRSAVQFVVNSSTEDDLVLVDAQYNNSIWNHYAGRQTHPLPRLLRPEPPVAQDHRLWVLKMPTTPCEVDEQVITKQGWRLAETRNFQGLYVQRYERTASGMASDVSPKSR